jgi:ubiquinone/menaquinone biosynthesis C-methylase UbiE
MATVIDPVGKEPKALCDAAIFADARVLEVGCGSGRLAFRYAGVTRATVGIDPGADDIVAAVAARPASLRDRVRFLRGSGVSMPFRNAAFDIAVFSWSL